MIRLKKDDGSNYPEWEEKTLAEISTRIRRKNSNNETDIPLTISSVDGLVNQKEYFNKIVASKDMSGYYLLKKDEFAYNKSYSKGFDFGSIKRLTKYEQGALSTLYICFDINKEINKDFISWYFDSQKWTREVSKYCAEGARNHGLLNISPDDFFKIKIKLPVSVEEQQKIADFLSSVDDVITESEKEVAALEEQKKGAMQKIFSQEVRFKADDGSDYPEWKSATFGDVFTMLQNNSFSRDQLSEDSGQIQNIHYGDVLVKFGSIIDCENDALPFINEDISTDKFNDESYIQNGDIIVADTAEDYTAGKVAEVQNVGERKILSGLHTMLCRPQKEFASCYLGHYLNSEQFHKQIVRLLVGTKVYSINKKVIVDTVLNYPCLEEQKKIANLLSDMDTSIDLAKQELEQWKELKKGLLQQLFE